MKRQTRRFLILCSMALFSCTLALGAACGRQGGNGGEETGGGEEEGGGGGSSVETMPSEAFASLAGKVTFDGSFVRTYSDPIYPTESWSTSISFGDGTIWFREMDTVQGILQCDYVSVERDGKVAVVYHTPMNEIAYEMFDDDFSTAYNPFALLEATDFVLQKENVYALTDTNKAKAATLALTGERDLNIASFTVTVEEGEAKSLSILSQDNPYLSEDKGILFTCQYDYTVEDVGTGKVPENYAAPYPETAETAALAAALQRAAEAETYTVKYSYLPDGGNASDSTIYVVQDTLYSKTIGGGYLERADGIYYYTYDDAKEFALLGEKQESGFDFRASFSGFAPSLLQFEGNTYNFTTDCYTYGVNLGNGLPAAAVCASAFTVGGTDGTSQHPETNAISLSVRLRDGNIYLVTYRYFNPMTYESGTVSLEFSAFGTTSLPEEIDLSEAKTLFEAYEGTYVDTGYDGTEYRLEITKTEMYLTIGSGGRMKAEDVETVSASGYLLVTFTAGGRIYQLTTNAWANKRGILLIDEEALGGEGGGFMEILLPEDFLRYDEGVNYPTLFYGTYTGIAGDAEADYVEYTVTVDATGVTVAANGNSISYPAADILYSNLDGLSIPDQRTPEDEEGNAGQPETFYWYITVDSLTAEGDKAYKIEFYDEDQALSLVLTRTDGDPAPVEIPHEYVAVGTYSGKSGSTTYYVKFTKDTLSVKIGDADFVEAVILQYVSRNFYITLDGVAYTIMNMDDTSLGASVLLLKYSNSNDLSVTLKPYSGPDPGTDTQTVEFPDSFLGTFKGTGTDGKEYILKLEKAHITVTVDGTPTVCQYTQFKSPSTLYFSYQGEEYELIMDTVNDAFALWKGSRIVPTLTRQTEDGSEEGSVPSNLVGVYSGKLQNKTYVFTFTSSGMTVTVDGAEATVTEFSIKERVQTADSFYYLFSAKINGVKYDFNTNNFTDEREPIRYIGVMDGWEVVNFNRVEA